MDAPHEHSPPGGNAHRLGIGTAQFGGSPYGVAGSSVVSPAEAMGVLRLARAGGITVIDTAHGYGDSEEVIGRYARDADRFRIVTKTAPLPLDADVRAAVRRVREGFEVSLRRLRTSRVAGLLVHRPADLLGPAGDALYAELTSIRREGAAERIGSSIYTADELDLITRRFDIDIVQVPISVLDQRLIRGGHLGGLRERGIEIHGRSVFLQGLVLLAPDRIPKRLVAARPVVALLHDEAARRGVSPLQAALGFVLGRPELDIVLCGVDGTAHLREILDAVDGPALDLDWARFALHEESVVDPSRWQSG